MFLTLDFDAMSHFIMEPSNDEGKILMELQTISQISKALHLSTRTLRYYEQLGLIHSQKRDDYAYRVYSEETVRRLQQIVILRKLRIPLKQIAEILKSDDAAALINAFQKNLLEIDQEITALSTLRQIISAFLLRLNESTGCPIHSALLEDTQLWETLDTVDIAHRPLKNEKSTADLQAASEQLNRLTDRDVRIVYLPPMTLASLHITGQDAQGCHAETISAQLLDQFIQHTDLKIRYPAARHFGFNNPDGVPDDDPAHGYERWISIPEDMEVPAPFVKKHLSGGLYAAHVIAEGAWDEGWLPLHAWVAESDRFDFRWESVEGVCGWLEEHLNYWNWQETWPGKINQIDLLLPIQPKLARSTRHPQA